MNEISISIPLGVLKTFDASVQQVILSHIMASLGHELPASAGSVVPEGRDEKGLARLDVSEAKLFLNKCSDKTISILQDIVNRDGDFMASSIADLVGTSVGELRGAWAGLTKRVRTITKDPEAVLFNWFKQGDDWHGIMAAQTVASMRIALRERG